jgi:hypothetical protein
MIISQFFEEEKWINRGKTEYFYNPDNNLNVIINKYWDSDNWKNNIKITHIIDTFQLQYEQINQSWSDSNWVNSTRFLHYFKRFPTDIDNFPKKNSCSYFEVSPNPVHITSQIFIHYFLENNVNLSLELINTLGIKIADIYSGFKEAGEHTIQFTTNDNLPTGTYWIRLIKDGKEQIVKPIVILQ